MGRRKKNASVDQDVKSFSETKEESLTVFAKQGLPISQEIIDMFDVKPVGKSNMIGGEYMESFNGKDYAESLKLAYGWQERYNKLHENKRVEFVNYYPQEFKNKSILIGYNLIIKEA